MDDDDWDEDFSSSTFRIVGQSTDSARTGDIVTLWTSSEDGSDLESFVAEDFLVCSNTQGTAIFDEGMVEHDLVNYDDEVEPSDIVVDVDQGGQLDLTQVAGPISAVSFQLIPGGASGETLFISPAAGDQYFSLVIRSDD